MVPLRTQCTPLPIRNSRNPEKILANIIKRTAKEVNRALYVGATILILCAISPEWCLMVPRIWSRQLIDNLA